MIGGETGRPRPELDRTGHADADAPQPPGQVRDACGRSSANSSSTRARHDLRAGGDVGRLVAMGEDPAVERRSPRHRCWSHRGRRRARARRQRGTSAAAAGARPCSDPTSPSTTRPQSMQLARPAGRRRPGSDPCGPRARSATAIAPSRISSRTETSASSASSGPSAGADRLLDGSPRVDHARSLSRGRLLHLTCRSTIVSCNSPWHRSSAAWCARMVKPVERDRRRRHRQRASSARSTSRPFGASACTSTASLARARNGPPSARTQLGCRDAPTPASTTCSTTRRVEVVHVTSPNHLHFPQVKAILAAGRHVVCEKPLAMTSAESAELVRLAARSGQVTAVNFNIRFYPLNQHLARAPSRAATLGDVRLVTGRYFQDWLLLDTTGTGGWSPTGAGRCARSATSARTGST